MSFRNRLEIPLASRSFVVGNSNYVFANHAKGGDGMNFDQTFWTAAVNEMASHFSGKGKAPDISAC
jgi:hypothetical protein